MAGFAFVAFSLALIGLFGLAAFMATQRTKEIGVRKVLGATSFQIARLLVWQFSKPVLWALVVALVAVYWFDQPALGVIVAVALVINLVIAAATGTVLPLAMRRMRIDPALAGGVVLTTVTDVVGFMTFLGLGAIFLAS